MKETNPIKDDDARLSRLLGEWHVDESLPPRFQDNVWSRIERGEIRVSARSGWVDSLKTLFARPAFATAIATVLLAAGLTAGLWRANHDTARWETELAHNYVASVNPYAAERP